MLKDNIKSLRKQKGLSQEELSVKLHVVRQTISKWEKGLSVPDSEMLVSISRIFDVDVSVLLGETISEENPNDLQKIAEKLEVINSQLLDRKENRRKFWHWFFVVLYIVILLIFISIVLLDNVYLNWSSKDLEWAVLGVSIHTFIWLFVRIVPFMFIGSMVGVFITRKK